MLKKRSGLTKMAALLTFLLAVLALASFHTTKDLHNPDFLMAGTYQENSKPLLISFDSNSMTFRRVKLGKLEDFGFSGIHETRSLIVNSQRKLALATYFEGKMIVINNPLSKNPMIEFAENFGEEERVRAIDTADLNGDGQEEIIVGTRPSGILKHYRLEGGNWVATVIDKAGATIHDLVVTDLDEDGVKEIFATVSSTVEADSNNLEKLIPTIIVYKPDGDNWKKNIVWKPDPPILENGLYIHARYIFEGDFDGDGKKDLAAGVIGDPFLHDLILIKSNGLGYSVFQQNIDDEIKLTKDAVSAGDIDGDGRSEIAIPSLTGEAILLYRWLEGRWQSEVLFTNRSNEEGGQIASIRIISPSRDRDGIILFSVPGADYLTFYFLKDEVKNGEWKMVFADKFRIKSSDSWGLYKY